MGFAAGTPGTWKQERLAAVTADPGTGTIRTGYLIRNLTSGLVKRHAGSYAWGVVGAALASAHSTLGYAASVVVDLAGDPYRTLTLTGNVTLTSSNRGAGRSVAVRILGDSSSWTLTLSEAWKWIGAAKPTALAPNKVAVLSLTAFGPSESDVIAAYAVDPLAEFGDQFLGVDGADPLDHAAAQVFLDALDGGGRCAGEHLGTELLTELPVLNPAALGRDPLLGAD